MLEHFATIIAALLGCDLKKILVSLLLTILLPGLAGLGHAQVLPAPQNELNFNANAGARDLRSNPPDTSKVTERQAVILARQQFTGNILRISLIGEGENQRYQIRMENEGKVFTVFVHATTGRITGGS
ncbi:MAG TPA: hypothetical protein DCS89_17320 [Gammaproteobacteria bacterium]|nr:hypothetical protein [Gammaproteobacteria bacterium]